MLKVFVPEEVDLCTGNILHISKLELLQAVEHGMIRVLRLHTSSGVDGVNSSSAVDICTGRHVLEVPYFSDVLVNPRRFAVQMVGIVERDHGIESVVD